MPRTSPRSTALPKNGWEYPWRCSHCIREAALLENRPMRRQDQCDDQELAPELHHWRLASFGGQDRCWSHLVSFLQCWAISPLFSHSPHWNAHLKGIAEPATAGAPPEAARWCGIQWILWLPVPAHEVHQQVAFWSLGPEKNDCEHFGGKNTSGIKEDVIPPVWGLTFWTILDFRYATGQPVICQPVISVRRRMRE